MEERWCLPPWQGICSSSNACLWKPKTAWLGDRSRKRGILVLCWLPSFSSFPQEYLMVVPMLVFLLSQLMVPGSTFTDKLLKELYLRCSIVYQVDIVWWVRQDCSVVRVFLVKPDNLSSIPAIVVEGQKWLSQVALWPPRVHCGMDGCTHL